MPPLVVVKGLQFKRQTQRPEHHGDQQLELRPAKIFKYIVKSTYGAVLRTYG